MPIVLKSRILNLLEPSGAVQACNGIALKICDDMPVCEMPLVFNLGSLLRSANLGLQETNLMYTEYVLRPREQSVGNSSTVGGC